MKRKRCLLNKSKCEDWHFAKRCIQRIGYVPDVNELVNKIQKNELDFYERQSNRVTVFKWTDPVTQTPCKIVYDKQRKRLITILFENTDEYNGIYE